jgi:alkanesulfonate monooxygenase
MSVDIYWRIAMEGDPASPGTSRITRGGFGPLAAGTLAPRSDRSDTAGPLDYMTEVARATEASGFVGGLMPSFPSTDDPWAAAAALAAETTSYRFMIAFQPGFLHPVAAARMSATLQALSGGRVVYNIISGGGGPQQLWWGDAVDHDDRYARTSEFLDVLKGVWRGGGGFDHQGRFYQVEGGGLPGHLAEQPFPEIYFSGSSPAAIDAAGRHADYYLSWLEPFDALAEKFAAVRRHAAEAGLRPPKFAVRADVLARETEEEAWAEIRAGWTEDNRRRGGTGRSAPPNGIGDSVGVRRAHTFAGAADSGDYRALEAQPGVWGGFDQLRPGPAFGLVGDYHHVAERLDDLMNIGVDSFILAGVPHLEEARRVGGRVLPLLKGRIS